MAGRPNSESALLSGRMKVRVGPCRFAGFGGEEFREQISGN